MVIIYSMVLPIRYHLFYQVKYYPTVVVVGTPGRAISNIHDTRKQVERIEY